MDNQTLKVRERLLLRGRFFLPQMRRGDRVLYGSCRDFLYNLLQIEQTDPRLRRPWVISNWSKVASLMSFGMYTELMRRFNSSCFLFSKCSSVATEVPSILLLFKVNCGP